MILKLYHKRWTLILMSIFPWSPVEPCSKSKEGLEHKREANLYPRASYQGPDASDLFIYLLVSVGFYEL